MTKECVFAPQFDQEHPINKELPALDSTACPAQRNGFCNACDEMRSVCQSAVAMIDSGALNRPQIAQGNLNRNLVHGVASASPEEILPVALSELDKGEIRSFAVPAPTQAVWKH